MHPERSTQTVDQMDYSLKLILALSFFVTGNVSVSLGTGVDVIVAAGDPVPDGAGVFRQFRTPAATGPNNFLFLADLEASSSREGLFQWRDGQLIKVATLGEQDPSGNGVLGSLGRITEINQAGTVAFDARIEIADGSSFEALFVRQNDQLFEVVVTDTPFNSFGVARLASNDDIAFTLQPLPSSGFDSVMCHGAR